MFVGEFDSENVGLIVGLEVGKDVGVSEGE